MTKALVVAVAVAVTFTFTFTFTITKALVSQKMRDQTEYYEDALARKDEFANAREAFFAYREQYHAQCIQRERARHNGERARLAQQIWDNNTYHHNEIE